MPTTKTWNILIVEDQLGDIHLIKMCLESAQGITLHVVHNAVQANQFILRRAPFEQAPAPDLVLLDLRMPIYDGSSVIPTIREAAHCAATKVVVFTSSRLLSDQAQCKKLGADDYINKPTDWPAWEATIRTILHKHLDGYTASA